MSSFITGYSIIPLPLVGARLPVRRIVSFGFITSQEESYIQKRLTLANSQLLHCFRAHSCHVLCDRLIFTPTQRKISHTVAYRVHSVPLVLLYSLQIADGNYCRLVLEN